MGVSNSDISWWALPDHVFLGSFTSAHPVAAIWYDAIILSFTWPMAGRATWQQAVLFIFPCLLCSLFSPFHLNLLLFLQFLSFLFFFSFLFPHVFLLGRWELEKLGVNWKWPRRPQGEVWSTSALDLRLESWFWPLLAVEVPANYLNSLSLWLLIGKMKMKRTASLIGFCEN